MFPILLHIGPLTLHTYGLMVALGFIAGTLFMGKEFDREGLPPGLADRFVTLFLVSGLLGARIFYFATENFEPLKVDPLSFFRVWEGGLVFYGGFIGGILALAGYSWKRKIPFLKLADAVAGPLLLGQALGRLGCFSAGCCYGKPTTHFFGIMFRNPESLAPLNVPLYPTQLMSSAGDFLLLAAILMLRRKKNPQGTLLCTYLIGYGTFRFLIEFLRGDFRGPVFGGLYPSQWISLVAVAIGLAFLPTLHSGEGRRG